MVTDSYNWYQSIEYDLRKELPDTELLNPLLPL